MSTRDEASTDGVELGAAVEDVAGAGVVAADFEAEPQPASR
jgi:hypothetical protein